MSFFTDKKEIQNSATTLGYVAHAVSLIASYLQVPLRYPLRLDASHSYIIDNAPSTELTSSEASSNANINAKHVEFPLFLEGQDTTRVAFAAFLLNKGGGMTYITYSNICTNLLRNCLKEPYKAEFLSREKVHSALSKWPSLSRKVESFKAVWEKYKQPKVGPQVIYVFGRDDNDESIATGSEISDVASWETVNDDEMEVLEDSREVCYNTCKKPIKDSQFAAHAGFLTPCVSKGTNIEPSIPLFFSELCRSLQLTKQTMLELDDNIGNRKPPRKEKKKLGASSANQASARREQRRSESLDNIDFALSQSYLNSQVRVVPFPNEVTGKLFSSNTSFEYKTVFYMSSEGKNLLHEEFFGFGGRDPESVLSTFSWNVLQPALQVYRVGFKDSISLTFTNITQVYILPTCLS
ncbi:hypothetical protein JHK87_048061 [Glycine soja]|nr:hypothetical protein JHK87_048061 [Glycine soja]